MARLIDADALIEECNNVIEEVDAGEVKEDYYDGYEAGVENIRDYAEHMPTIDAIPVGWIEGWTTATNSRELFLALLYDWRKQNLTPAND